MTNNNKCNAVEGCNELSCDSCYPPEPTTFTHVLKACADCSVLGTNREWCRSCHADAELLQKQEEEMAKLDAISKAEEITQNGPYGPLK